MSAAFNISSAFQLPAHPFLSLFTSFVTRYDFQFEILRLFNQYQHESVLDKNVSRFVRYAYLASIHCFLLTRVL
jgi:hypothetical protein